MAGSSPFEIQMAACAASAHSFPQIMHSNSKPTCLRPIVQ
jgi:hypothetical protein